jgi:hypothetical protein
MPLSASTETPSAHARRIAVASCMHSPFYAPLSICEMVCCSNPDCLANCTWVQPRMVRMRRNRAPIDSTTYGAGDITVGTHPPSLLEHQEKVYDGTAA